MAVSKQTQARAQGGTEVFGCVDVGVVAESLRKPSRSWALVDRLETNRTSGRASQAGQKPHCDKGMPAEIEQIVVGSDRGGAGKFGKKTGDDLLPAFGRQGVERPRRCARGIGAIQAAAVRAPWGRRKVFAVTLTIGQA